MPSRSASASTCCSTAQQTCGPVGARVEPAGVRFVYGARASTSTLGIRYGPTAFIVATWVSTGESAEYAPPSISRRARRASSVPSLRAAVRSSNSIGCRVLSGARNSSRRVSTSRTGRRAARASAATWASKWKSHLPPKPPPSVGTITRT
jgi:hypothetical protein